MLLQLNDRPEEGRIVKADGFLAVARPIIDDGLRQLRCAIKQIRWRPPFRSAAYIENLIAPSLYELLLEAVEQTMVLELNVARLQGTLTKSTSAARFEQFCQQLERRDFQRSIWREYPLLLRQLKLLTRQWVRNSAELLLRLQTDWSAIQSMVGPNQALGYLVAISASEGDRHDGGQTVAVLSFSSGCRIVYHPRNQDVDRHFGELIEWINGVGFRPPLRCMPLVARAHHGWTTFVESSACTSPGEVERFYCRLGGFLALFYVLGARDMHFENVIAAGEYPVFVDVEALFHWHMKHDDSRDPAAQMFERSVLPVMLLPHPTYDSDNDECTDFSAFGAKSGSPIVSGLPGWERHGTDRMHRASETKTGRLGAANRPRLGVKEVDAGAYVEPFERGFRRLYRLLRSRRRELMRRSGLIDRFSNDQTRFIARGTAIYQTLLHFSRHPDCLRSRTSRDSIFRGLANGGAERPHLSKLVAHEIADLRRGDIPRFVSRPASTYLRCSDGTLIRNLARRTALQDARKQLAGLSERDLTRQLRLMRASMASIGIRPTRHVAHTKRSRHGASSSKLDPMELASYAGDLLLEAALQSGNDASWIGSMSVGAGEGTALSPLDCGLYNGAPGCTLFLAYLAAETGDRRYESLARKALNVIRRKVRRIIAKGQDGVGPGAFTGTGGLIYLFVHLGVMWNDPRLLDDAEALARVTANLVIPDERLDLIGGSGGAIVALDLLNRTRPRERLLDMARRCGDHLCEKAKRMETGVAWITDVPSMRPLTGFSHGAAGIAWALRRLFEWSRDPRYLATAHAALAYERSTFNEGARNWPDYRHGSSNTSKLRYEVGWCHGAPGVGLGRLDFAVADQDVDALTEIDSAVQAILRKRRGLNISLCHGDLGDLDILHMIASRLDRRALRGAYTAFSAETIARIAQDGWVDRQAVEHSFGLMVGLAGTGYGLLRIARPDRVPSVLELAGPRH